MISEAEGGGEVLEALSDSLLPLLYLAAGLDANCAMARDNSASLSVVCGKTDLYN